MRLKAGTVSICATAAILALSLCPKAADARGLRFPKIKIPKPKIPIKIEIPKPPCRLA